MIEQGRVRELTSFKSNDYDVVVSDNSALLKFLKDKVYVGEAWEEEGVVRVHLNERFAERFFIELPSFIAAEGLALKLFKPHTSPLEKILMKRFKTGWEG